MHRMCDNRQRVSLQDGSNRENVLLLHSFLNYSSIPAVQGNKREEAIHSVFAFTFDCKHER